jgi:hypothetical protein
MLTRRAYRAVDIQRTVDPTITALCHWGSPAERGRRVHHAHHARDLATLLGIDPGFIATQGVLTPQTWTLRNSWATTPQHRTRCC